MNQIVPRNDFDEHRGIPASVKPAVAPALSLRVGNTTADRRDEHERDRRLLEAERRQAEQLRVLDRGVP